MGRRRIDPDLLFDENGNVEKRFLPVDRVVIPDEIELSADQLAIGVPERNEEDYWHEIGEEKQLAANCLSQFIRLADQPATRILQFARRWGMLGICEEHALPSAHNHEARDIADRSVASFLPYRGCSPSPTEKISDWKMYSRRFRELVEVGQRLHRGERITDDAARKNIGRPRRANVVGGSADSIRSQKRRLARAVNVLLAACGIQPVISWDDAEPIMGFGVFGAFRTSLFSALTMQLAMTVSDCKIAVCSACHKTYRPKRRTHPGKPNYCPDCRRQQADVRVRVQRFRDRRRSARIE